MAQRFPITTARRELGFATSTAVRANIDTRTGAGAVGAATGQAGLAVAGEFQRGVQRKAEQEERERKSREAIELKRQQMTDDNNAVLADKLRKTADANFETFKLNNLQETWEPERVRQTEEVATAVAELNFSPDALAAQQVKSASYSSVETAKSLTAATRQLRTDTIEAQTEAMVEAFRSGGAREQLDAVTRFRDNGANMGKDKVEVLNDIKAARVAGRKLKEDDAIDATHAEIEAASITGDFETARQLATNSAISEARQTILRNTISTAEKAVTAKTNDAQTALVNKTTSDSIREFFAGELTVPVLNKRHSAGLVKDSEFKFMMSAFQDTTPANSDPFAASRIRRAQGDFEAGDITQEETEKRILQDYTKLDGPDRSGVLADLEDIGTRVIGTAKTNAYDEGRGLMSVQFVGIKSQDDLFDLFAATTGLTEEEKKRINRRWEAEVSNRDLYERAVDSRFREMRKEGVTDTQKFQAESLRVLLQYQRRKRLGLEQLEAAIREEQQVIVAGKPVTDKPVKDMTVAEKQAELQRIRELKQLTR